MALLCAWQHHRYTEPSAQVQHLHQELVRPLAPQHFTTTCGSPCSPWHEAAGGNGSPQPWWQGQGVNRSRRTAGWFQRILLYCPFRGALGPHCSFYRHFVVCTSLVFCPQKETCLGNRWTPTVLMSDIWGVGGPGSGDCPGAERSGTSCKARPG